MEKIKKLFSRDNGFSFFSRGLAFLPFTLIMYMASMPDTVHGGPYLDSAHGDGQATIEGAGKLCSIIDAQQLTTVCGYNYVTKYDPWREKLDQLLTV